MNLNKLFILTTVISTLTLSSAAQAGMVFAQAGDIADKNSPPVHLTKDNIASYYKDGKSGDVTFACTLLGERVTALVYAGKNFVGNPPAVLDYGYNGPFTWKIHDKGEANGNIKIQLIRGSQATVKCLQAN